MNVLKRLSSLRLNKENYSISFKAVSNATSSTYITTVAYSEKEAFGTISLKLIVSHTLFFSLTLELMI